MRRLPISFYHRPVLEVARDIIGKILIRRTREGITTGRIIETEAYGGIDDPASHAFPGKSPRNEVMFGPAGRAYVYFIYGMYYCVNVVTGQTGQGEACLIRAIEPLDGISLMLKRRKSNDIHRLTNGPGKLCIAMNINSTLNGISYRSGDLTISDDDYTPTHISISSRIGIRKAKDYPWRFFITGNPFVSK